MPDPWAVLGLSHGSSLAEARAARRRLAKELHPDLHAALPPAERAERARRMILVNRAIAELASLAELEAATPVAAEPPVRPDDRLHPVAASLDADSFAIEALPVDAFEALCVAGYNLGEILVADEPYALELYLPEPTPCFCQLFLGPEAGRTIVTMDVTPAEDAHPPDGPAVRDLVVSELNRLARVL